MAKISARGAHQVAAANTPDYRFVLRSDRVILRRFRGPLATGYTRFGKIKPTAPLTQATLDQVLAALGYQTI